MKIGEGIFTAIFVLTGLGIILMANPQITKAVMEMFK